MDTLPELLHAAPPAHLWRRAVVDALRPHVASIPGAFDDELCALDALHTTWWQRYGRAAATDPCRNTEASDRLQVLLPLVEKLVALQTACQHWPVKAGRQVALALPSTFDARQCLPSAAAAGGAPSVQHHPIRTPIDAAAVLLLEDAVRTHRIALQRLDDVATSTTQEPCFVAMRAKESYQLCQSAVVVATAASQLPLVRDAFASPSGAFYWSEVQRARQVSHLGVAASQYLYALWTEATSSKHNVLASLAMAAANACSLCGRMIPQQRAQFETLSRFYVAASLRHRGEQAYAADLQRKEVPDMRMAVGCMAYAAGLLKEDDGDDTKQQLPLLFPIADRLKRDVQRLLEVYTRENDLIYHARPMPKEDIPSLDAEAPSLEWVHKAPFTTAFADRTAGAGSKSPFLSDGPNFSHERVDLTASSCSRSSCSSSSDEGDRFHDAQEAAALPQKLPSPSCLLREDLERVLRSLMEAFSALDVTQSTPIASGSDRCRPLWVVDVLQSLKTQLNALRCESCALHEQQKQFVTANVKDPTAAVVKTISEAVAAWYASAFAAMQAPCGVPNDAAVTSLGPTGGGKAALTVGDVATSLLGCVNDAMQHNARTTMAGSQEASSTEHRVLRALVQIYGGAVSRSSAAVEAALLHDLRSLYEGPVKAALLVATQLADALANVRRCAAAVASSRIPNATNAVVPSHPVPTAAAATSSGNVRHVGSRLKAMLGDDKRARSNDAAGDDGGAKHRGGARHER